MPKFYPNLLFITVFFTGAAVLIFEITAVRALSPFFGTSIFVVSSVLSVILAALSVGYYVGGRLADRYPDPRLLYLLIATSGLIMNALYWLALYVFPLAGLILPITFGPLILAILFFFVPAFLLGIDSPFVIKLLTKTADEAHNGAVVGSTFFWSTIGSILGSLASGFYLIPFMGVRLTIVGTATLLSIGACLAFLYIHPTTRHHRPYIPPTWLFAVSLVSVLLGALTIRSAGLDTRTDTLLWRGDGFYSQIEIRERTLPDRQVLRSMYREVNNSSSLLLGTTTFAFPYAEFARAHELLDVPVERYLVIGGGAYTVPRTLILENDTVIVDVVELEPKLFPLAQTFFDIPTSSRLTNYTQDARTFLARTDKVYDVIFLDAFNSGHYIPPHLITHEFFSLVQSRLSSDGILVANVIGQTHQSGLSFAGSALHTIHSIFPNLAVYTVNPGAKQQLQNLMVIARPNPVLPVALPPDTILPTSQRTFVTADELYINLADFHFANQTIFTDDRAPVEYLVGKQIATSRSR